MLWPWDRKWHAVLIKTLKELGAKAVFFDVPFSVSASEREDALLKEAIKENGNVYLPCLPIKKDALERKDIISPIDDFSAHAKGIGSIAVYPDIDGILRRVPLFFKLKDNYYYNIGLIIAADCLGLKIKGVSDSHLILSNDDERIEIPLAGENSMLVSWMGKWKDVFQYHSFLSVLSAYKSFQDGQRPNIDLSIFKDSICLISVTAVGLCNIKPIPLESEYPVIGITATTISNILSGAFIRKIPLWGNFLLIYLLAFIPAIVISKKRTHIDNFIVILFGPVFFIILLYFFIRRGVWIDWFLPLLAFFVAHLVILLYDFLLVVLERQYLYRMSITDDQTKLYNRRYLDTLLNIECKAVRAGAHGGFCVVMVDLDDFSKIYKNYGLPVAAKVLIEICDVIKNAVRKPDIVVKYGGEELLVLLREPTLEDGMVLAEKMRIKIRDHIVRLGKEVMNVTASFGVASFSKDDDRESIDDDKERVVERADKGLYKAKKAGKNRVETIEPLSR